MEGIIRSNFGFYFGDPCYALSKSDYQDVWGRQYDYEDGEFVIRGDYRMAVKGTLFGDGEFYSSGDVSKPFTVESGTLCLIPAELVSREKWDKALRSGVIIDGAGEASYQFEDGIFNVSIGSYCLSVDTQFNSLEEEDDE